jgi:hypothetical protein
MPCRGELYIYVHATYYVIPIRVVGFWLLIGIAVVWSPIATCKFVRVASSNRLRGSAVACAAKATENPREKAQV